MRYDTFPTTVEVLPVPAPATTRVESSSVTIDFLWGIESGFVSILSNKFLNYSNSILVNSSLHFETIFM